MQNKYIRWMVVALLGLFFGILIGSMILGFCTAMPGACGN